MLMGVNLLFTVLEIAVRHDRPSHSTHCLNTTFQQKLVQRPLDAAALALCIECYLVLGIICIFYVPCNTQGRSVKTLCQRSCRRWRGIVVLIAGVLYLVGDNLSLVDKCTVDLCSCLLVLSFSVGLIPAVHRHFGEGLGGSPGRAQDKLIDLHEMTVDRLYPMLMFTVQIDQIYTALVGVVSHHKQEFHDGTKCPSLYVKICIAGFFFVWISWSGVAGSVIIKHIRYILKFEKANPIRETKRHKIILVLFGIILFLYIPAYIALDNWAPWICVAKYHFQEWSTTDYRGVDSYKNAIIGLLIFLSFCTFVLIIFYIYCCKRKYYVPTTGTG